MKVIILILTIPHIILSFIFYFRKSIFSDYQLCVDYIKNHSSELEAVDDLYFNILVLAEDHRNSLHIGVDPFAILRCIFIKLTTKKTQGGSTIEQQFVRTLTQRYDRTIKRKIREQILSILLNIKIRDKKKVGKAYLYCAYFGYNKKGYLSLDHSDKEEATELIARLKYPTKRGEKPIENNKIALRKKHIEKLIMKKHCTNKTSKTPDNHEIKINK